MPRRAVPSASRRATSACAWSLDGGPAGYGLIQRGDSVAVYATFKESEVVAKADLRQILSPAQLAKLLGDAERERPTRRRPFKFTVTRRAASRVLNIQNPVVVEGNQFDERQIPLTLDLSPEDAQAVSYALVNADLVNLGLLPPGERRRLPDRGSHRCLVRRSMVGARDDRGQRRRRRDAAVLPPTAGSVPRGRAGGGGLGPVRDRGRRAPDPRLQPDRCARALTRGEGARRPRTR